MIKASEMKIGQKAVIKSVLLEGALKLRFTELGLNAGTVICLNKTAPFKGPMEFIVRSYRLCLRREEASQIFVELLEGGIADERKRN